MTMTYEPCGTCEGAGVVEARDGNVGTCGVCDGSGKIPVDRRSNPSLRKLIEDLHNQELLEFIRAGERLDAARLAKINEQHRELEQARSALELVRNENRGQRTVILAMADRIELLERRQTAGPSGPNSAESARRRAER